MLEKEKVMELKILNKQGQSMKAIVTSAPPARGCARSLVLCRVIHRVRPASTGIWLRRRLGV